LRYVSVLTIRVAPDMIFPSPGRGKIWLDLHFEIRPGPWSGPDFVEMT